MVQATQVCDEQIGVAPLHWLLSAHCTHWLVDVLHTGLPLAVQCKFAVHSTQVPLARLHAARVAFLAEQPLVGALVSPQATQVWLFPQIGLPPVVHWLLVVHSTHLPVPASHVGLLPSLSPQALVGPAAQATHTLPWQIGLVGSVHWLLAVQATHRPLGAQVDPVRPLQSRSPAHFAHRLFKQSGLCGEQSWSLLQVPGASMVGASGTPASERLASGASIGVVPAGASGAVSTMASGGTTAGAPSGPGPSSPDEIPVGPSGLADAVPTSVEPRWSTFTGPSLPPPATGAQRKSEVHANPGWHISAGGEQTPQSRSPPPAASVGPWLSRDRKPSAPPSTSRTHVQSAVHVNPFWHWSWGEHRLQSRTTQESPDVTGKTSASTLAHATIRVLISQVLGCGLNKLLETCATAEFRYHAANTSGSHATSSVSAAFFAPCPGNTGKPRGRPCLQKLNESRRPPAGSAK